MKLFATLATLTALLLIWAGCANTDSVNFGLGWKKAYPVQTKAPPAEPPKLPMEPRP